MSVVVDNRHHSRFPASWRVEPFSQVVFDVTGGNAKIKRGDYRDNGSLPVIDQGSEFIGGYVDNNELACKAKLPCVLFGDHTRIFKYVDEPFALGADGVKVLTTRDDLDTRFAYHYLRQVRLPEDAGYSRHFKFLKEFDVPLPPLEEQKRIAAILDKADAIRRKRAEALRLTDDFLKSVFLDMFGDPVTNPKGWETKKFGDTEIGTLDRGRSRHRPRNAPELLGGPYPLIQTGEVANCGLYITEHTQTYSEIGLQQSKMWPAGTLCITIAANIAKTGILKFDACFPDSVVGFTPSNGIRTEYVQFWLSFLQRILEESAPESAQKNINLEILRKLDIPVPEPALQDQFVNVVKKMESASGHCAASRSETERLFGALVQRAFRGEL